jgi:glycosyltransferase involved in cell wall biosynthesis
MDDRLKIGFVAVEDAGNEGSWSGTPYHLLNALKKQDVSIEVFSPLNRDFRYALAPFKIAARLVKREIWVDRYPLALRSYARQLKKKMRQNSVDVILSIGTPAITLLECAVPIVFYTDAIFHLMPGYYGGIWDRLTPGAIRLGRWQEETALERCTIGVYSSNWAAEGARKYTRPEKIRVVPFGANVPVDHDLGAVQKWASERMSRLPAECRLLFIGVDWVRKGGAIAVETARLLNEMGVQTKLTIVGCQPNEEVPAYVKVLGFVNKQSSEGRKQLEELYRHATFFILPTRAEASAIVFCEASAYGVPTITFKTGGVEDYVREGVNGICLPLDSKPEVFARRIKEILEDRDRYFALCLGAFNEYKTRLNWDGTASALVSLCREAVRGRPSDP